MTKVAKYNTYKGISTALTFGTPLVTMCCVGDMFVHQPAQAISGAGVLTLLIVMLFTKEKLAEYYKSPGALKLSITIFIICVLVKNIVDPMLWVTGVSIATCGVDELTFKSFYKRIELSFPQEVQSLKR